ASEAACGSGMILSSTVPMIGISAGQAMSLIRSVCRSGCRDGPVLACPGAPDGRCRDGMLIPVRARPRRVRVVVVELLLGRGLEQGYVRFQRRDTFCQLLDVLFHPVVR